MDELDRMALEAEKFNKKNLDKKKIEIDKKVEEFDFRTLLDAVELLYELRAKRQKSIKDQALIDIIEKILSEEPFEYKDEDYILTAYKKNSGNPVLKKKSW